MAMREMRELLDTKAKKRGYQGHKMGSGTIQAINDDLRKAGLDGNGRFRSVGHAHSTAGNVLEMHGYEFTDMLDSWKVKDESGYLMLRISQSNPTDAFSPVEVANTAMAFQFTKLGGDRVEVVAYLG